MCTNQAQQREKLTSVIYNSQIDERCTTDQQHIGCCCSYTYVFAASRDVDNPTGRETHDASLTNLCGSCYDSLMAGDSTAQEKWVVIIMLLPHLDSAALDLEGIIHADHLGSCARNNSA
jgi:hypothetical protein